MVGTFHTFDSVQVHNRASSFNPDERQLRRDAQSRAPIACFLCSFKSPGLSPIAYVGNIHSVMSNVGVGCLVIGNARATTAGDHLEMEKFR